MKSDISIRKRYYAINANLQHFAKCIKGCINFLLEILFQAQLRMYIV